MIFNISTDLTQTSAQASQSLAAELLDAVTRSTKQGNPAQSPVARRFASRRQGDQEDDVLVGPQGILVHGAIKATLRTVVSAESLSLCLGDRRHVHDRHATEELLGLRFHQAGWGAICFIGETWEKAQRTASKRKKRRSVTCFLQGSLALKKIVHVPNSSSLSMCMQSTQVGQWVLGMLAGPQFSSS